MRFTHSFKDIFKPTAAGIGVFSILSTIFIAAYILAEYKGYLSAYQAAQQSELRSLNKKTKAILGNLTKLSQLTSARIIASPANEKRVQHILSFPYHFDHGLPSIQKFSYDKLSNPQMTITRFGVLPLNPKTLHIEQTNENKTAIAFDRQSLVSRTPVLDDHGRLEGVLKIKIDLSDFQTSLGSSKTITFDPSQISNTQKNQLLQKDPFAVYAKPSDGFRAFTAANQSHYAVFCLYTALTMIFLALCIYVINACIRKTHKNKLEHLEADLSRLTKEKESFKEALFTLQQDYKSHQASCQSYKKFHIRLSKRQKEYAAYMLRSLAVLDKSLKDSSTQLSDIEEAIKLCLTAAKLLASGLFAKIKNESIDLHDLLEGLQLIFAEKIYKSNVTFKLNCPKNLPFYGDRLFIEFILMNLIGKPIYKVPKDGKISVTVLEQEGSLQLKIRDNGYFLADTTEKLLKKSFDFFMPDDDLHCMCQANGLDYEYSKADNGLNVTRIIIPPFNEDVVSSNVVKLFK